MDMKLEVVPIPVRDVDAAKDFYTRQVGFGLDHDVRPNPGMRVVQMTPPGSACSVVIAEGLPLGEPGSIKGVQLVVEDLDAIRRELAGRGVGISEVQQMGPEGTPGSRFCFFDDPDGNTWAIQEYKHTEAGEGQLYQEIGGPRSCRRTSPTSLPSEVVTGELSRLRSTIVRRISATLTNGRYVLGPGRMARSTGRSGSAWSSLARSSPSTTRSWLTTTHASHPAAMARLRTSPSRSPREQVGTSRRSGAAAG